MVLRHWDPFHEMRRRNGGLGYFWNGIPTSEASHEPYTWGIPVDVVRKGDEIVVHATLPGVDPDEIEVSIEENLLTIQGSTKVSGETGEDKDVDYLVKERRTGSFRRTLRLPKTADVDKARPNYDNGVLTVSFPKLESKKAKQLKVTTGHEPE